MPLHEVERRVLWLSVWHSDMFGRNDFLGEVMLPMTDQQLDDQSPKWYSLSERVSCEKDLKKKSGSALPFRNFLRYFILITSFSCTHFTKCFYWVQAGIVSINKLGAKVLSQLWRDGKSIWIHFWLDIFLPSVITSVWSAVAILYGGGLDNI